MLGWAVLEGDCRWVGSVAQVVKITEQSVMILDKSWDGTWSTKPTRRAGHNVIAILPTD